MRDPNEYYMMFCSLRRHFSSSYDFVKYRGKSKISLKYLENNKHISTKLSKQYTLEEFKWLCIANLLDNPSIWISSLLETGATDKLHHRMKCIHSMKYNFKNDLRMICEYGGFNAALTPSNSQVPAVYKLAKCQDIQLESVIVLDKLLGIFKFWLECLEKNIYQDIVSEEYINLWMKYERLIDISDIKVYKDIIVDYVSMNKCG